MIISQRICSSKVERGTHNSRVLVRFQADPPLMKGYMRIVYVLSDEPIVELNVENATYIPRRGELVTFNGSDSIYLIAGTMIVYKPFQNALIEREVMVRLTPLLERNSWSGMSGLRH
jgi:hypothetical protein